MHCVNQKCIMVKVGGNETHIKYVKKQVNFTKSEGGICKSRKEIMIFPEWGGEMC